MSLNMWIVIGDWRVAPVRFRWRPSPAGFELTNQGSLQSSLLRMDEYGTVAVSLSRNKKISSRD